MKKILGLLFVTTLFLLSTTVLTSCSRKTGCPATENATVKAGKKGLPTKRGKSALFPKSMGKSKRKNK